MSKLKWNLKELMDARGLKVRDLVEATGLSYSTVNAIYRNATSRIDKPTAELLAAALRIPPSDLFGDED
jgi:transcriptional regulator with XRE-family HTH domain